MWAAMSNLLAMGSGSEVPGGRQAV